MQIMEYTDISFSRKLVYHFALFSKEYLFNLKRIQERTDRDEKLESAMKRIKFFRGNLTERYLDLFTLNLSLMPIEEFLSVFKILEIVGKLQPEYIGRLKQIASSFGILFRDHPSKEDLKKKELFIVRSIQNLKFPMDVILLSY